MSNEFIPAKDAPKMLLKSLIEAFEANFPNLKRGTEEYEKTLIEAAIYCFGGKY